MKSRTLPAKSVKKLVSKNVPPANRPLAPAWHSWAEIGLRLCALTAVAAIVLLFVFITKEAFPLFFDPRFYRGIGFDSLTTEVEHLWLPAAEMPSFSLIPLMAGSFKIATIALLIAAPLGTASALFSSTYLHPKSQDWVRSFFDLMAGIPSIVIAFVALAMLSTAVRDFFSFTFRLNAIVAGIAIGFAMIPLVFSLADEAMQGVPNTEKEAAIALGARPYQITLRIVLPAAIRGIGAAWILAFSRALGETMIALMVSGNSTIASFWHWSSGARTISATIAAELGEVAQGSIHWRLLFFLGLVLFVFSFVLNSLGGMLLRRNKESGRLQ